MLDENTVILNNAFYPAVDSRVTILVHQIALRRDPLSVPCQRLNFESLFGLYH